MHHIAAITLWPHHLTNQGEIMMSVAQTLLDEVFVAFRLACELQQYRVADHLLAALEQLAGDNERLLDDVYLSFAFSLSAGGISSESAVPRGA